MGTVIISFGIIRENTTFPTKPGRNYFGNFHFGDIFNFRHINLDTNFKLWIFFGLFVHFPIGR